MSDIPEPEHVVLAAHLGKAAGAHDAVAAGIATHAQKETAARDERRRQAEALARLQVTPRAAS